MDQTGINNIFDLSDATQAETRILQLLGQQSGLRAAEISRLTGLSKSTVARAVEQLRGIDMVVEMAQPVDQAAKRGRPGTILALNPAKGTCAGVLLGPDTIELTIGDLSHALISQKTVDMPRDYGVERGIGVVKELIDQAYRDTNLDRDRLLGVGIAVPGPVDFNSGRVLRSSMVPVWAGVEIRTLFETALRTQVFADNESNCAAIAEMTWGAAKGESDFLYFKLDVGVGGAVVVNGHVLRGVAGGAGEVGHMVHDAEGPLCRCGNRGCVEMYAGWDAVIGPAKSRFGPEVSFEKIAFLALDGDIGCKRLIEDVAVVAGRALANACAVINPPLVVLGGRQIAAGEILIDALRASFARYAHIKPYEVEEGSITRIIPGAFSNNRDTALGAVGLVLQNYGQLI
ncbi:ROK family protein [Rhizobium sp. 2YAF20]|uniref:ROK family transcriptional regulator n=1 Tax=Rhizobium sp. 2YAF20 TaxID=3233027 RepID=UPI003F99A5AC